MAPQIIDALDHPATGETQVSSCTAQALDESEAVALRRNSFHEFKLEQVQNILHTALDSKHAIDLEQFKRTDPYPQPEPTAPRYLEYPREPQAEDPWYQPVPGQGSTIVPPQSEPKKCEAYEVYVRVYTAWAETVKRIESENQKRYAESVAAIEQWNSANRKHRQTQAAYNDAIDKRKADYAGLLPEAVEDYCRQVLLASKYPEDFHRAFDLQYLPATKTLIVEHALPVPANLPRIKGLKYVKSRGGLVEVSISDTALNRLYADVLCQICVRTFYELFDADVAGGLNAVIFNGWVESTDIETGNMSRKWVMTAQSGKEQFHSLNLWDTDAKACFKALKGVASAKLHTLAPVVPIVTINRQDTSQPQAQTSTASTS